MKKSSKSSLKKRSLDISLQHKDEASYKFLKKILHLAENRAGAERAKPLSVLTEQWVSLEGTCTGIHMLWRNSEDLVFLWLQDKNICFHQATSHKY